MSSDKLTINERRLAQRFVENGGNAKDAYMRSYSTARLTDLQITKKALEALARPHVRAYIRDLRTEVSGSALFDIQTMVNELVMIITASPAEIIKWKVGCCRHCYGIDHRYQWRNDDELAEAQAVAIDGSAKRLPDDRGGFGFDSTLQPHAKCPHCNGEGVGRVEITDTDKLSPQAARLYQGVKIGSNGSIEVKLRNQDEAMRQLMRIYGVYNPAAMLAPPKLAKDAEKGAQGTETVDVPQDPQQAADYYENFIKGQGLH